MSFVTYSVEIGSWAQAGATFKSKGVNFCLLTPYGKHVELLLFDRAEDREPMCIIKLDPTRNKTSFFWHIFVRGLKAGHYTVGESMASATQSVPAFVSITRKRY